jgi:hypothetical protein
MQVVCGRRCDCEQLWEKLRVALVRGGTAGLEGERASEAGSLLDQGLQGTSDWVERLFQTRDSTTGQEFRGIRIDCE